MTELAHILRPVLRLVFFEARRGGSGPVGQREGANARAFSTQNDNVHYLRDRGRHRRGHSLCEYRHSSRSQWIRHVAGGLPDPRCWQRSWRRVEAGAPRGLALSASRSSSSDCLDSMSSAGLPRDCTQCSRSAARHSGRSRSVCGDSEGRIRRLVNPAAEDVVTYSDDPR